LLLQTANSRLQLKDFALCRQHGSIINWC